MRWVIAIAVYLLAGLPTAQHAYADPQQDYYLCATIDGDHHEAVRRCTAAIESGEFAGNDLAWAYHNRSYELRHLGDFDTALSDSQTAISIVQTTPTFWGGLADTYKNLDRRKDAIDAYTEALRLADLYGEDLITVGTPNLIELFSINLFVLHEDAGNEDAARHYLERAYPIYGHEPALQPYFQKYGLGQ